jgi:hypothetical protein
MSGVTNRGREGVMGCEYFDLPACLAVHPFVMMSEF